jgi:hypothetical protein
MTFFFVKKITTVSKVSSRYSNSFKTKTPTKTATKVFSSTTSTATRPTTLPSRRACQAGYQIVRSDDIALKLIKQMNQQKLQSENNFLPLNVLKLDTTTSYPERNHCIPLINKMTYGKRVENAVKHVFDKLLLCRNSDVATQLAKQ